MKAFFTVLSRFRSLIITFAFASLFYLGTDWVVSKAYAACCSVDCWVGSCEVGECSGTCTCTCDFWWFRAVCVCDND